jgi:hypothetical protein
MRIHTYNNTISLPDVLCLNLFPKRKVTAEQKNSKTFPLIIFLLDI